MERTLRPRAEMSLTWIWPLEGPAGAWDEERAEEFVDLEEDGVGEMSLLLEERFAGGSCMLKSGA